MSRVMVVEDEQIIARDIADSLTSLGYEVTTTASSADECLRHAENLAPDLVLMDIHLTGQKDGVEAARLLRKQFDVPVVFLTAYADDRTVRRAKATGPLGYLVKPFRKSQLKSAIEVGLFRHRMERRLRRRERWFSTTLRAIGDAVIAVNGRRRVWFMNAAAEQLTGHREDAARGRKLEDLFQLVHEQTRAPVEDPVHLAIERREVVHLSPETALLNTKRDLPVEDSVAPIVDERGRVLGAVIVLRDISERRRAEQQLALADRLASLGTVAAGVGHEINNPLTYVLGSADFAREELRAVEELIRETLGPSHVERQIRRHVGELGAYLGEIEDGVRRIRGIVADLNAFARTDGEDEWADVVPAVRWAMRVSSALVSSRAQLVAKFDDVPPVVGDPLRLGQVFLNLIVNAAHAMDASSRQSNELFLSCHAGPDECVHVVVRDTGCGMTEDVTERIFEPFFTTKPVGQGTGLGLSVCRAVLQSVGGSIEGHSELDVGSTFVVRLPLAHPRQAKPSRADNARLRILLIDDDPRVLSTLKRLLETVHAVEAVRRAEDALSKLASGARFDAILSDLLMPGMNGMEFHAAVRERTPANLPRIVFMTGGISSDEVSRFLKSTSNHCLFKPILREELLQVLDRVAAAERETRADTTS